MIRIVVGIAALLYLIGKLSTCTVIVPWFIIQTFVGLPCTTSLACAAMVLYKINISLFNAACTSAQDVPEVTYPDGYLKCDASAQCCLTMKGEKGEPGAAGQRGEKGEEGR